MSGQFWREQWEQKGKLYFPNGAKQANAARSGELELRKFIRGLVFVRPIKSHWSKMFEKCGGCYCCCCCYYSSVYFEVFIITCLKQINTLKEKQQNGCICLYINSKETTSSNTLPNIGAMKTHKAERELFSFLIFVWLLLMLLSLLIWNILALRCVEWYSIYPNNYVTLNKNDQKSVTLGT